MQTDAVAVMNCGWNRTARSAALQRILPARIAAPVDPGAYRFDPGDYRHPKPLGDLNGDYQVDQDDVGFFAHLQGTDLVRLAKGSRPAAAGHP